MSGVFLILVLYCGQPVSVTLSVPEGEGKRIMVGPIDGANRAWWIEQAVKIEKGGGRVERIKVEEQVEGLRCPVST